MWQLYKEISNPDIANSHKINYRMPATISKPLRHAVTTCQAVFTSQRRNRIATKCIFEFSVSRLAKQNKQTRKLFSSSFLGRASVIRSRSFPTWVTRRTELELMCTALHIAGKRLAALRCYRTWNNNASDFVRLIVSSRHVGNASPLSKIASITRHTHTRRHTHRSGACKTFTL